MNSPPLAGIKVLELARILAGPWAGQLLADLGADVVKVERAGEGDDTRHWGPPYVDDADGNHIAASYFYSCNRGKRCIAADYATDEGRALVRKLAAHADIVIENFKVGGLKKFGLDYEGLKTIKPDVIYCSITGFGQDGPYASRPGYDFLAQGMGGIMHVTGQADGPPTKVGVSIVDIMTGMYASNAIQAALIRRQRTGEGAFIDCALLDSVTAILGFQAMNLMIADTEGRRLGNKHPNVVPYDVYRASDGEFIIASANEPQFKRLVTALGRPEMADDPRFVRMGDRAKNRVALDEELNALTSKRTRADNIALLDGVGVPAGPINTVREVFDDPHVKHRSMRIDRKNPRAKSGTTPGVRSAIIMDGMPAASPRHAPALGEHTDEVLADPAWGGNAA